MIDKIIKEIDEKQEDILSNLNSKSIKDYIFIKNEFDNDNILNNSKFQSRFKSFYRMNSAGLSDSQKKRFFELLSDKSDKQENLTYILSELYEIPRLNRTHSIQFSFATKLLHTINNNKPIYDKKIAEIINICVQGANKNKKILSCIEIYNFLEKLYLNMLQDKTIINIISEFRLKFKVNEKNISNIKVLDFIMWSLGDLKRKN